MIKIWSSQGFDTIVYCWGNNIQYFQYLYIVLPQITNHNRSMKPTVSAQQQQSTTKLTHLLHHMTLQIRYPLFLLLLVGNGWLHWAKAMVSICVDLVLFLLLFLNPFLGVYPPSFSISGGVPPPATPEILVDRWLLEARRPCMALSSVHRSTRHSLLTATSLLGWVGITLTLTYYHELRRCCHRWVYWC